MKKKFGEVFVLLAAFLWGTTGTVQKIFLPSASPVTVGAMRLLVAAVFLNSILFIRKEDISPYRWFDRNILISALCIALYQPFFFLSVRKTGVAVGTVVAIASAPIFSGAISAVLFRETPVKKWYIATLFSIVGCVLLFYQKTVQIDMAGIFFALMAGLAYSIYAAHSKKLLKKYSPLQIMGVLFIIGTIILTPIYILEDISWVLTYKGGISALFLGVFATALPYCLYTIGLRHTQTSVAVTLTLGEPLMATILGLFLLNEKLSSQSMLGLLFLLLGIVLLVIKWPRLSNKLTDVKRRVN